jgi:hypothetical protein
MEYRAEKEKDSHHGKTVAQNYEGKQEAIPVNRQ